MFKDGSILVGNTCINDEHKFESKIKDRNKNYIRGTNNLSMFHIRPHYDVNIQHTKVTFYNHVYMNGAIPTVLINANYMELVKNVTQLENNIKSVENKLHEPGMLWLFPNYMKML